MAIASRIEESQQGAGGAVLAETAAVLVDAGSLGGTVARDPAVVRAVTDAAGGNRGAAAASDR